MSRTNKGGKGAGFDFTGRRAKSLFCSFGPYVKVRTHRIERRDAKTKLRTGAEMLSREAF